jgi:starch-binding outer membrane protein, SusD/RagB family
MSKKINEMQVYKILFFCVIIASLASCQKNVLNKQPLGEISADQVWRDIKMATLYIDGIYLALPGSFNRNLDCNTRMGEEGQNWHPLQLWNTGDVGPYNNSLEEWYHPWTNDFRQIRNANTVLENYTKIPGDQSAIDQLKGQALFLRAYYYADLVNFYGGVPIISKTQQQGDSIEVTRNTYDECISFIVADLDAASNLLPINWEGANVGRATKGAALALKSRMLLFAASPLHNTSNDVEKWQAASDAAKAVIDLGVYELYPDYYQLFHADNNQEVIFDIQYAFPTRTQGIEFTHNPQGISGAWGEGRPSQDFVDSYEMRNGKKISAPSSGYNFQDPYANRDPRFYASVLYNGAPWRGGLVETFTDGVSGPGVNDSYNTGLNMTGYYTRKFLNENNPVNQNLDKANENWILMRYAEVLLNYAEAQLNLGNETEARLYISKIRERAGMPEVPDSETGNDLLARYQNERKIELAFEEIYFFDVRRWKTAPDEVGGDVHKMDVVKNNNGSFTYTVKIMENRAWRDAFYYFPIPGDEINKDKNLTQNPDY